MIVRTVMSKETQRSLYDTFLYARVTAIHPSRALTTTTIAGACAIIQQTCTCCPTKPMPTTIQLSWITVGVGVVKWCSGQSLSCKGR